MIYNAISCLINKGIETGLIEKTDHIYVRNQIMHKLQLDHFPEKTEAATDETIPDLLEHLVDYAVQNELIDNVLDEKEILAANIMNCMVPLPSTVNAAFWRKYASSPESATDYFYQLSKSSNYIQTKRIANNIHFKTKTDYGNLDITINLSKPEKDPEQIRREREIKQNINYPKCVLCIENEGYAGRTGHPPRANHRVIRVPLLGENWHLQYSPYVYYNEHSIVFAEEHRNMRIDRNTFERLLAFTDRFPHYFIGSNADLPIVGGSILSHDHYQGGQYRFAMTDAEDACSVELDDWKEVSASVLNWPLSVLRLKCDQQKPLLNAADHILQTWKRYTDTEADINAFTGDTPHNTITPIARIRDGAYELDLVLRNNRTSDEHPLGIFHPHADVHHIKKENIGLIEVMGLAVLPARLKDELDEIRKLLLGEKNNVAAYHKDWALEIKAAYGEQSDKSKATDIIRTELGKKFTRVLEHAGVFKRTNTGEKAFKRFLQTVNERMERP
ncbi:UDP-glucose--hexose-1-phosphate uridylyltransferase [Virgibacillus siamensis]|uniref:UDP-glucose--hexose-1-phosphate uridylyltransferase n=1 Tax=Virgibacillus siamensis TaxID=480071 RepID=UPI000985DB5B|nr:UDP-glucose--hexose-1-phosphate uridylyltransferase [Virgibacillus siamensis]